MASCRSAHWGGTRRNRTQAKDGDDDRDEADRADEAANDVDGVGIEERRQNCTVLVKSTGFAANTHDGSTPRRIVFKTGKTSIFFKKEWGRDPLELFSGMVSWNRSRVGWW